MLPDLTLPASLLAVLEICAVRSARRRSPAAARFTTARVRRYGRTDAVRIAEIRCLWYGSFHTQSAP